MLATRLTGQLLVLFHRTINDAKAKNQQALAMT